MVRSSDDFPKTGETDKPLRFLVVDDYQPWCRFVSAMVRSQSEWRVVGEASDGSEAVHMAQQLQPDLIMLDIGLPKLNGFEAARQIREVSPTSKILFVSENSSREIAETALNTGAGGYVVKSDAGSDLLTAVRAVLAGKRFISASLTGSLLVSTTALSITPVAQLSWILMFVSGMS